MNGTLIGRFGRPLSGPFVLPLPPVNDDDLVIVLMRGGFSRLENTLFEDGKFLDVRTMRHAFQDTMQGRFTEVIERVAGREVVAFMSASHQRPISRWRFWCSTVVPTGTTRQAAGTDQAGIQDDRVLGDGWPDRRDPLLRRSHQRRRQRHGRVIARQAWLYVSILGGAYFISRGLAKSGSAQPYDEDGDSNR